MWFVRIIFWLQAFAAPVILCGLIGLLIGSMKLFVPLLVIGELPELLWQNISGEKSVSKFSLHGYMARMKWMKS